MEIIVLHSWSLKVTQALLTRLDIAIVGYSMKNRAEKTSNLHDLPSSIQEEAPLNLHRHDPPLHLPSRKFPSSLPQAWMERYRKLRKARRSIWLQEIWIGNWVSREASFSRPYSSSPLLYDAVYRRHRRSSKKWECRRRQRLHWRCLGGSRQYRSQWP